jgi:quinol monooxygenase YgiN
MLINAVMYTVSAEKADEVARLISELRAASLREEGCLGYEAARGEDNMTFVLFEKWRDQGALDAHYATDHFQRLALNGIRLLARDRRAVRGTLLP